jgi:hypothetical protein
MNTKLLIGAGLALATLAGGHVADAKCQPRPPVVRVAYDDHRRIDVSPPQRLDVIFTRGHVPKVWAAHWGSDSSLAWAQAECDDMGGHAVWHNGSVLECQGVDY